MIDELLSAIGSGQSWNMAELSRHLGASEGMIAQMLSDLAHRGYVESAGAASAACPPCGGRCAGCAYRRQPDPGRESRAWRLTEKGRRRARAR